MVFSMVFLGLVITGGYHWVNRPPVSNQQLTQRQAAELPRELILLKDQNSSVNREVFRKGHNRAPALVPQKNGYS